MGNVVPTGAVGENPRNVLPLLDPSLVFQEGLGGGRFFKTVRCQTSQGPVVVKIYAKREPGLSLAHHKRELTALQTALRDVPSACAYERFEEAPKANVAFLIRPYFYNSLYDRFSTRPFLTYTEKQWISFQLLTALQHCHDRGIIHGDVKSENIVVTSWNWVVITDFAPFKPASLPADEPGAFHYFFATSNRESCCIAPERLRASTLEIESPGRLIRAMLDSNVPVTHAHDQLDALSGVPVGTASTERGREALPTSAAPPVDPLNANQQVNDSASTNTRQPGTAGFGTGQERLSAATDIFSAGCVIREIFTHGEPCFNYSELLKYANEGRPTAHLLAGLAELPNPQIRALVAHMLSYNSHTRLSARQYIAEYSGKDKLFPAYFIELLEFMTEVSTGSQSSTPDARVWAVGKRLMSMLNSMGAPESRLPASHVRLQLDESYRWYHHKAATEPNEETPSTGGAAVSTSEKDSPTNKPTDENSEASDERGEEEQDEEEEAEEEEEEEEEGEFELPEVTAAHIESLLDRTDKFSDALRRAAAARYTSTTSAGTAQQDEYERQQVMNSAEALKEASRQERTRRCLPNPDSSINDDVMSDSSSDSESDSETWISERINTHETVDGVVLLTNLLCTSVRHVRDTLTRQTAVVLLRELALLGDDEVRLERVVPFIVSLLVDDDPAVRCLALRTLVTLLDRVDDFPTSDSRIFPEYLLPALAQFPSDSSELVRLTFTECLPKFAEISRRFLEIAHSKVQANAVEFSRLKHRGSTVVRKNSVVSRRASIELVKTSAEIEPVRSLSGGIGTGNTWDDSTESQSRRGSTGEGGAVEPKEMSMDGYKNSNTTVQYNDDPEEEDEDDGVMLHSLPIDGSFDRELQRLHDEFEKIIARAVDSAATGNSMMKRALLRDVSRLCVFFGRERTDDFILPLLITFLNERNEWQVRAAFYEQIAGVAVFVGPVALEQFLLPCIEQALQDSEEQVVQRAVTCIVSLVRLDLLSKSSILDLVPKTIALTLHPCCSIRTTAMDLIAMYCCANPFTYVDVQVSLVPQLMPAVREVHSSNAGLWYLIGRSGDFEDTIDLLDEIWLPPLSRTEFENLSKLLSPDDYTVLLRLAKEQSNGYISGSISNDKGRNDDEQVIWDKLKLKSDNEDSRRGVLLFAPFYATMRVASRGNNNNSPTANSSKNDGTNASTNSNGEGEREREKLPATYGSVLKTQVPLHCIAFPHQNSLKLPSSFTPPPSVVGGNGSMLEEGALIEAQKVVLKKRYGLRAVSSIPVVVKYGEAPRAIATSSESMSGSVIRLERRIRALEIPPLRLDVGVLRNLDGTAYALAGTNDTGLSTNSSDSTNIAPTVAFGEGGIGLIMGLSGGGGRLTGTSSNAAGEQRGTYPSRGRGAAGGGDISETRGYVLTAEGPTSRFGRGGGVLSGVNGSIAVTGTSAVNSGGTGGNVNDADDTNNKSNTGSGYRPAGVLVATLNEHSRAVNRIAVSQDSLFFATGSDDGTVRLWLSAKLDREVCVTSRLTYASQGGRILDLCTMHNSHSVVSASSNGSVHVFKVEHAYDANARVLDPSSGGTSSTTSAASGSGTGNIMSNGILGTSTGANAGISSSGDVNKPPGASRHARKSLGVSTVFEVDKVSQGAVCAVHHFNTATESLIMFATEFGELDSWDLRWGKRASNVKFGPQAGLVTCMAVSPDGFWLVVGTARGVMMVWDIRFQVLIKAWRLRISNRIHRLHISRVTNGRALVYAAAGNKNQVCLWDLDNGMCVQVLRSLGQDASPSDTTEFPTLDAVTPLSSLGVQPSWHSGSPAVLFENDGLWRHFGTDELKDSVASNAGTVGHSVRAFLCPQDVQMARNQGSANGICGSSVPSPVITAGTDRSIRLWCVDTFGTTQQQKSTHRNSYTISGVQLGTLPEVWIHRDVSVGTTSHHHHRHNVHVFSSQPLASASVAATLGARTPSPMTEGRGPVPPSTTHEDCVLDLNLLAMSSSPLGTQLLLSASRDGVVKVWR